jgi:hypothetical protein
MFGQLDPEVGLGLLPVIVVLTATAIAPAAADIALVPLMTADGIDICIAPVVVFADLQPSLAISLPVYHINPVAADEIYGF